MKPGSIGHDSAHVQASSLCTGRTPLPRGPLSHGSPTEVGPHAPRTAARAPLCVHTYGRVPATPVTGGGGLPKMVHDGSLGVEKWVHTNGAFISLLVNSSLARTHTSSYGTITCDAIMPLAGRRCASTSTSRAELGLRAETEWRTHNRQRDTQLGGPLELSPATSNHATPLLQCDRNFMSRAGR